MPTQKSSSSTLEPFLVLRQASPGLESHGVTARERASALPKKTGRSKPRLDAKYRAPLRARVLPLVTTRGTSTRRRLARAASTPQSLSLSRPGRSPRLSSADRPLRFKTRVHLSRARDERLLRAARARRPVRRERGQAEAPDRRQDLQGAHGPVGERARGAPFRPPARRNEGSHPSREPRTATTTVPFVTRRTEKVFFSSFFFLVKHLLTVARSLVLHVLAMYS